MPSKASHERSLGRRGPGLAVENRRQFSPGPGHRARNHDPRVRQAGRALRYTALVSSNGG